MAELLKSRQGATAFSFVQGDSLSVDIEPCDLLFIDTRHTAAQLTAELERHAGNVRRRIVLHDTQIFGERGEDGGPGLLVALRAFLKAHPEWSVIYHTQVNHGLTVISRDQSDKPALPGRIPWPPTWPERSLPMWLTGFRKRMHRNSSVGWKPVQFANCETTTAARSVAVTSLRKPRGDPANAPLENGIRRCLMSSELPFVSCLCPTYRRPQMMANTIPCFITQDYPADRRELIILDDAGELKNEISDGWQIISIPRRFRSLPEKFNALAGLA